MCMEVILDQLRYPEITNEKIRAIIPKYIEVVMKLVSQRQRCGRVVRYVERFSVLGHRTATRVMPDRNSNFNFGI